MAEEIPLPPPSPPLLLPPPAHLVLVECFGFRRALAKDAAAAAAAETQTLLSNGPNFLFLSSRPQFSLSAEETTWPPFHFSLSLSLSLLLCHFCRQEKKRRSETERDRQFLPSSPPFPGLQLRERERASEVAAVMLHRRADIELLFSRR